MRLVVASCYAYRDCWRPLMELMDLYFPDHPPVNILTDRYPEPFRFPSKIQPRVFVGESKTWCERVASHAAYLKSSGESACMFIQEDFFLKKPVDTAMIDYAVKLMYSSGASLVRLYPSPAGTAEAGDPYFAEVPFGTPYRISCHAAIVKNEFLADVAKGANWTTGEARDYENLGTPYADTLPDLVLSIKEGVAIPFDYHCTAVSRGLWDPNAIKLCREHGIDLDLSLRAVAAG